MTKHLFKHIAIFGIITAAMSGCSLFKKEIPAAEQPTKVVPLYPIAPKAMENSADAIAGKWYILTVGTMTLAEIEDDRWPYIDFVASESRFYGTDGCNILNGEYQISGSQDLTLSNVASTMRLCQGDSLSYPIQTAINSVAAFSVADSKPRATVLSLKNAEGKVVMTLTKSDIDFLNGAWQVVGINGKSVDVAEARLIFDIIDGHISGNAGCNSLRGDISRNPKMENSIQISNIATTRMACPNLASESALLIALEEVVAAVNDGNEYVNLLDATGKPSVKLKRLTRSDF